MALGLKRLMVSKDVAPNLCSCLGACQCPEDLKHGQGCELQNEGMKQREDE
jgi:hypothetical protein